MDFLFPCGFFLVVLTIAGIVAYFSYLAAKKRTEELSRLAEEMGFDFEAVPGPALLGEVGRLFLFQQGHGKTPKNLLRGEAGGMEVRVFDYTYTTGGGKNRSTWSQTVLCFRIEGANLPAFSLRPQHFFHVIGAWFGYQDINFETHPKFSKTFLLRGTDEEAVRKLFTPTVLEHYETLKGICTEGDGELLVYYRQQKRVAPNEVRGLLEDGFKAIAAFGLTPAASA